MDFGKVLLMRSLLVSSPLFEGAVSEADRGSTQNKALPHIILHNSPPEKGLSFGLSVLVISSLICYTKAVNTLLGKRGTDMTREQLCIMIAIVLYLGFMLYLGARYSKSTKDSAHFYLGGRVLGPYVVAMSAEASDMSSWLLMGLPGVAYFSGICEPFWTALGLGVGTYLNWLIVAKRLRYYSEEIHAVTIPSFFHKRFGNNPVLLVVSAAVIVTFFIPYTASGFNACGTLFSSLFGIDYLKAMLVSAIVIVAYTAMGGFNAASTTDFIQSIVMSIALMIVLCFGLSVAGGTAQVSAHVSSLNGYLSLTNAFDPASGSAVSYGGVLGIVSTLAWGLGYFGMPHILLRFMAIRDPEEIKVSRRVGTVWVFIAMTVAVCIGMIGLTMTQVGAIGDLAVNGTTSSQRVIIEIANLLATHGVLPALLAGVVMAGILACTMSTCDSQLLAAASSVSEDLLQGVFKLDLSIGSSLVIARVTLLLIAAGAAFWAREEGSVFTIVSFAWAGFGAAFGPVMLCALFWKRTNAAGAIAGMLGGGVMVFVWKYMIAPMGGVLAIYELFPAFVTGLVLTVVVSLLTPAPAPAVTAAFDHVAAKCGK